MTQSKHLPVTSFGAQLHSVLREGANKELRLTFGTEKLATRFAQRINALRNAMRREKHPDWQQLYRCGVHKDTTDPRILIVGPRDSEFTQAIKNAGVKISEDPPESVSYTIDQPAPGMPLSADSFLATLRDQTTVPPKEKKPRLDEL
jgi:hypothetical protein